MNLAAKRAFVLADWMKAARRCESEEEFNSLLSSEKKRVDQLQERELDEIIAHDKSRLKRFDDLVWTLETVSLTGCRVYSKMGERPWAIGTVGEVSEKFLRLEAIGSRIWKMKHYARIFSSQLPLIVVVRGARLEIDDGSHRAVAMHLAGIMSAKAYLGRESKKA